MRQIGDVRGKKAEVKRQRRKQQHLPEREARRTAASADDDPDHAAHHGIDASGGPDGDDGLAVMHIDKIRDHIGYESAAEIDKEVSPGFCAPLHRAAERAEQDHIVEQMPDAGVQEHRRKEPPVLPLLHVRGVHRAPADEDVGVFGAPRELTDNEQKDVGRNKRDRDRVRSFHNDQLYPLSSQTESSHPRT